ncbi:hypothetical protein SAMN05428949_5810 [Chitinophaga sp. YR627]|uniref:DUF7935 family protein n=1 Tax=Chitinophaga sp. YR627 TaxID=1881041 RepID=UPI0008F3FAD0|nr:hypothetical protein [Chitinophaga sp. YR627]SFO57143.1 hypothetical protein SAMN05428949_5810 [Chitinophaga sp. YR627]
MDFSNRTLLFILLAAGAIYIAYTMVKDTIRKPKDATPAPDAAAQTPVDKSIRPLQLAAYERLVLLVERINLQNMISRIFQPGLTAVDMQVGLIQTIKAEFEHNIAQQIYVSPTAWEAVKTLKEQTITIVNQVASQLPPDATAMDLNKQILEVFLQAETSPSELTSQILNAEAKRLF